MGSVGLADDEPPEIEYLRFLEVIGLGGYSDVFLYEQLRPRMRVAVKVLKNRTLSQRELTQFSAEAEAMAQLADHPYIVQVFRTGTTRDHRPYLVMKYYPGLNLAQATHREQFGVGDVLRMGIKLASAVETAHRAGILHRDIKPANVLTNQYGEPGLTDFGLVGNIEEIGEDAEDVGVSIPWASPEVLSGASNGSVSSDVYSLAATLWNLLARRSPFEIPGGDNSPQALLVRILSGSAPHTGRPDVPMSLERLLAQALDRDPAKRPGSAMEFAHTLQAIERELRLAMTEIVVPLALPLNDNEVIFGPTGSRPPVAPTSGPLEGTDQAEARTNLPDTVRRRAAPPMSAGPGGSPPQPPAEVSGLGEPIERRTRARPDRPKQAPSGSILRDRYLLVELLAEGPSGDLYRAYDKRRGTDVAIKLLDASNQDVQYRLERGGRVWLNLSHPRLVRVFDVVDSAAEGPAFVVSSYIAGQNLATYLQTHDLSVDDAIHVIGQLCDALAYLHDQDVVHREINQRNVMLSSDTPPSVTLLDSGVARQVSPGIDEYTRTGTFVGDLAYAAPEQFAGERVTARADIWAVAALLYDLTCRTPRPIDPAGRWQPQDQDLAPLPSGVRRAIQKGLSAEGRQRYRSIRDLQLELGVQPSTDSLQPRTIVVALHGIRTRAAWQRAFSEIALEFGVATRLDRWNFGYFSLLRFASPSSRAAKVRWFREIYQAEFPDVSKGDVAPSVVAHSFGTYILGNALVRYPYLRFDKVLLCGSILPRDFPWAQLIARGQVGEVRNEYGVEDVWTRFVGYVIPQTGPSGLQGFSGDNECVQQERFDYSHSEYFSRAHMASRWLPFLASPQRLTAQLSSSPIDQATGPRPVLLWLLYGLVVVGALLALLVLLL